MKNVKKLLGDMRRIFLRAMIFEAGIQRAHSALAMRKNVPELLNFRHVKTQFDMLQINKKMPADEVEK